MRSRRLVLVAAFGAVPLLPLACGEAIEARSWNSCFAPDTLVETPSGPRPIGSLAAGDVVLSANPKAGDPKAGAVVERRVERVLHGEAEEAIDLDAGDVHLRGVTPSHPFWVASRGRWVDAGELVVGDVLLALHRGELTMRTVESVARRFARSAVVNLTVEGPEHTFFAGRALVHNKSTDAGRTPLADVAREPDVALGEEATDGESDAGVDADANPPDASTDDGPS